MADTLQASVKITIDPQLKHIVKQALINGITDATKKLQAHAKQNAPNKTVTLEQQILADVDETNFIGTVTANVFYAVYVEYGTGIYAENGRGRSTPWTYQDDDGNWWHNVRGQKPNPFMRRALNDHIKEYNMLINNSLKRAL